MAHSLTDIEHEGKVIVAPAQWKITGGGGHYRLSLAMPAIESDNATEKAIRLHRAALELNQEVDRVHARIIEGDQDLIGNPDGTKTHGGFNARFFEMLQSPEKDGEEMCSIRTEHATEAYPQGCILIESNIKGAVAGKFCEKQIHDFLERCTQGRSHTPSL